MWDNNSITHPNEGRLMSTNFRAENPSTKKCVISYRVVRKLYSENFSLNSWTPGPDFLSFLLKSCKLNSQELINLSWFSGALYECSDAENKWNKKFVLLSKKQNALNAQFISIFILPMFSSCFQPTLNFASRYTQPTFIKIVGAILNYTEFCSVFKVNITFHTSLKKY